MIRRATGASLSVLMMLGAGAADAAVTADQLWAAWQTSAAGAGMSLSAETTTREGAVLRLEGVTLSMSQSDDPAATLKATVAEIVMTDGTDGAVTVVPTGAIEAGSSATPDSSVMLNHDGGQMRVTEDAGVMSYDVTGTTISAEVKSVTDSLTPLEDGTVPKAATDFLMTLAGPAIRVTDTPALNRTFGIDIKAQSLSYQVNVDDPGMQMKSAQSSTTEGIAITGQFMAPSTVALAGLTSAAAWSAALKEGMALTLSSTQGPSQATSTDENAFMPMAMAITSGPGTASLDFGKDGFALASQGDGLAVSVTSAMLPFPKLDFSMGALAVDMSMPILSATEPGDYGVTVRLTDVSVNEEAWAALDPAGTLPRDPAQLVLDAKGTMKLDLLALMAAEEAGMTEVVPPQPLTLDIPEVLVSVAGATLTGTGAFTFDNATGQPVPAGTADVTLTGGNALLDKLVAIGLLTDQDAGGARMMMSMFMNATGEDVLTSKIEAKPDGSISVNGQRVQ